MAPQQYPILVIFAKLIGILLLVFLNGFFVAAEFAIVKVRSTQIETLVKKHHHLARVADNVIHHLDAYLSATQLGITLASLGLGWLGEPFVASFIRPLLRGVGIPSETVITSLALGIAFAFITFLHIVVGELAPKSLAIQKAQATTLWVAIPLTVFYRIFQPAILFLNGTANLILKSIGIEPVTERELIHSEEELRLLLADSSSASPISELSRSILLNAFTLKNLKARNIMLPRNRIVPLFQDWPIEENLKVAKVGRHTRFPLCKDTLDQVLGMVHIKDLLWHTQSEGMAFKIEALRREILFIPEFVNLETMLSTFLEKKCHMAIIVDEFGGTLGMVTLEDVLEELVGEIQDEFDQELPLIRRLSDKTFLADGATPLHDAEDAFGVRFADQHDATTLGGYIVNQLGDIPAEGEEWAFENLQFVVQKVEKMRVSQILVKVRETK